MPKTEIAIPAWAGEVVKQRGLRPDTAGDRLRAMGLRDMPAQLRAAATACVRELERRAALRADRRALEGVQRSLNARMGKGSVSETETEPDADMLVPWPSDALPTREEVLVAVVLLEVQDLDDLRAAMRLNSWRASVHYENYELAHDNQVIGFHNAALRSRAEAAR